MTTAEQQTPAPPRLAGPAEEIARSADYWRGRALELAGQVDQLLAAIWQMEAANVALQTKLDDAVAERDALQAAGDGSAK